VLGIDRIMAGEATIKRAYRSLTVRYPPDLDPHDAQAAERMKEIN
jgi:DnaJ-class molecular chaperone